MKGLFWGAVWTLRFAANGRVLLHLLERAQAGLRIAQIQVHLQVALPSFHVGELLRLRLVDGEQLDQHRVGFLAIGIWRGGRYGQACGAAAAGATIGEAAQAPGFEPLSCASSEARFAS